MPDWVADKQRRLEKIREAKAELEAEAKAAAAEETRRREEAEKKRIAEGRKKNGKTPAPPKQDPEGKTQRNFTDPESRVLLTKEGYIQATTRRSPSMQKPRSSCPTPAVTMERIEALRRQRFTGQQIARDLGVSPATVSRVLRRLGLNRMAALEPAEPVRRYERERPGELIHIDIKKLASSERAIGSPAIAPARATAGASAGNTFTGPSTTIPDWPIRRSCPTRSAAPACASCSTPCASSAGMASPSSAS
jgi:transcriptional regulator with XRE-family HTH domain